MLKYAKIVDEQTKLCEVGVGTDEKYYQSIGLTLMDVEQAYNGQWYINGFCPVEPKKTYVQKRQEAYPALTDQLDMLYWDQINKTSTWQETITQIKQKFPKE